MGRVMESPLFIVNVAGTSGTLLMTTATIGAKGGEPTLLLGEMKTSNS
jgi:hypothetical protein